MASTGDNKGRGRRMYTLQGQKHWPGCLCSEETLCYLRPIFRTSKGNVVYSMLSHKKGKESRSISVS